MHAANRLLAVLQPPDVEPTAFVTEPRCRTCCSPRREVLERLWAEGVPPMQILAQIPDHDTSGQSLRRHVKRGHISLHYDVAADLARQAGQKRWQASGLMATARLAADVASAQQTADLGLAALAEGRITPTVQEMLDAARFLQEVEQRTNDSAREVRAATKEVAASAAVLDALVRVTLERVGSDISLEIFEQVNRRLDGLSVFGIQAIPWLSDWRHRYINSADFDDARWDVPSSRWREEAPVPDRPSHWADPNQKPGAASEQARTRRQTRQRRTSSSTQVEKACIREVEVAREPVPV